MRREKKQSKSKQTVAVPNDLIDFLRYVHEMIDAADDSATIESDDLLQCEHVYGGLIEDGGNRYRFTYFPEKGIRHKWEFHLDVGDIAKIADGRKTDLVLWGCQDSNCRCMFSDSDDTCFYCDCVEDDLYGTFSMADAVARLAVHGIEGLSGDSTKEDVIRRLGDPQETGGGVKGSTGYILPWIKYHLPECQLRFEFSKSGGRIRNVTFLPTDWHPGV